MEKQASLFQLRRRRRKHRFLSLKSGRAGDGPDRPLPRSGNSRRVSSGVDVRFRRRQQQRQQVASDDRRTAGERHFSRS
jgi:hypothetical protein